MKSLQHFFGGLLLAIIPCISMASDYQDHVDFEKYSVYYNVFNSTFIPADVAANYGIKRSKYESLINVSISHSGEYGAIPAKVSGTVTNLMQQQKQLKFIEIAEKTATYYIAPIRIAGEENVRIELSVTPAGESKALKLKFNKKIYSDP
jgi:hypothetical protein